MHLHRLIRFPAALAACLVLISCGSGSGSGGGREAPQSSTSAPPTLTSLRVSPASPSVSKGLSQQFTATATYSDGSTANVTSKSIWASTVTAVATIEAATGLARSLSLGTTSITATIGAINGSTTITATAAIPQSLLLSPAKLGASVGANEQLKAILTYSDGSTADASSRAAWTSAQTSVATVNAASGLVTGVAAGTATVTAAVAGISANSTVHVVNSTWAATGSLSRGTQNHAATLLSSGKVLVVGGEGALTPAYSTWSLYDPVAETWSSGNLVAARARASSTLLGDGRVLIAGGDSGQQFQSAPTSSAEIYDPATAMTTATGNLITGRAMHTATLLPSGKVLIAGGHVAGNQFAVPTATSELYDPSTASFVSTGNMVNPHFGAQAILLANGKLLVVGGGGANPSAEIYDPATQIWSATGNLPSSFASALMDMSATLLPNGKVLVTGGTAVPLGQTLAMPTALCELYDPATNLWTATGSLNVARSSHSATVLANGKVLVVGGTDGTSALASAERYDVASATWFADANLPHAVAHHTATLLQNGELLVVGGVNQSVSAALSSALLYTQ